MPTELNAMLMRGRAGRGADLVDRVRPQRRPAAAAAPAVRLHRGRRRLDPADHAQAAGAGAQRRGDAGERDLGGADPGAAGRRRAGAARPAGRRADADRRRRAAQRVRRPDAAPRPGAAVAGAHRPADGVRRVGLPRGRRGGARGAGARAPAGAGGGPVGAGGARPPGIRRSTAGRRASWPATSRSCATTSARASSRACCASSSWPTWPASWTRCPSCASSSSRRRRSRWRSTSRPPRLRSTDVLDRALAGERITDADAATLLESRELVRIGRVAHELRNRRNPADRGHVRDRPQPELHQRLLHRLQLLRLLPAAGRRPRGLHAAAAGDLQEDRGDAGPGRHRAADAGRPQPGAGDRLVRGPVPLDQGPLPDPPARAFAERGAAHLAQGEAADLRDAVAAARRRARLAARAAAPRSSPTASATSSRPRRRRRPSGWA